MQWLIDLINEQMAAYLGIPPTYVPRITNLVSDYQAGDLTLDGAYHTLDLSAIVPAGASAVNLACKVNTATVNSIVRFRHPDDTRDQGRCVLRTQVANIDFRSIHAQGCDSNRHIEYYFSNVVWNSVIMLVRGWWL